MTIQALVRGLMPAHRSSLPERMWWGDFLLMQSSLAQALTSPV